MGMISRIFYQVNQAYPMHQVLVQLLYRSNLKNWEFDKEAPQNFCLEGASIAERQGASENENYEVKPMRSKNDSSSYFGIAPDKKI
jgi:hypothetical protein